MAEKAVAKKAKYTVNLPLTSEKQDDVTVIINGNATKIKRGVDVEVSAEVFEVLQNSQRMDNLALLRRKNLAGK